MIPLAAEKKLADFVDVFCERWALFYFGAIGNDLLPGRPKPWPGRFVLIVGQFNSGQTGDLAAFISRQSTWTTWTL